MSASSGRDCKKESFAIHKTQSSIASSDYRRHLHLSRKSQHFLAETEKKSLSLYIRLKARSHEVTNVVTCTFLGDVSVFQPRLRKSLIFYPSDSKPDSMSWGTSSSSPSPKMSESSSRDCEIVSFAIHKTQSPIAYSA